jgi:RNA polymerase sigma-70 factor, ECF subfamily
MSMTFNELGVLYQETKSEIVFKTLFKKIEKPIKYYINNFIHYNQFDSDDIFSEVIVKVYLRIEQYNSDYNFSTWLYTIAKNECLKCLNERQKVNHILSIEEPTGYKANTNVAWVTASTLAEEINIQNHYSIDESVNYYSKEDNAIIESNKVDETYSDSITEIEKLPDMYRDILKDRLFSDMKYKDIADKHNIDIQTVKNRIFHSKKIVKRKVEANI